MLKRIVFAAALALAVLLLAPDVRAAEISARCAVVYEPRTETLVYQRQPELPMLVASTTKIMTAMVVLERCALDEHVTVTEAHHGVEGSSAWLIPGEDYSVEVTFRIENMINDERKLLKEDNMQRVDNHEYPYALGASYADLLDELEHLGDFVVNVVQARLEVK